MPATLLDAINLPFDQAIAFFKQKARVPSAHWTDVWQEAHSRAFMVAGAASDALLEDFQREITRGLEDGTTLATFRTAFDEIVERHGWDFNGTPGWRSEIIYDTNLSTAFSAGRYAQLTEPDTLKAFPFWTYYHGDSTHPRPWHLAWNGITLPADDPFWAAHFAPNGWKCSCRIGPTSEAGLARMGKSGPDPSPKIEYRTWRNPHTGAEHQVPVGIDPGFAYNPGRAWQAPVKSLGWQPVGPEPKVIIPKGSTER